jgi:phage terminase large subunit
MSSGPEVNVEIAPKLVPVLFTPSRYKVAHGGRGSAKSWGFARGLIVKSLESPRRILCTRELQVSIRDSVHKLLTDQIEQMGLERYFAPTQHAITNAYGSEFLFEGLRHNTNKIKSMEGIDIVWAEEAEKISESSWNTLIPTIRKPGSEIWVSFNPDLETDPTYKRFVLQPPPDARVVEINWSDNPWFPEELRREKDYLYRVDPDAADNVWGGQPRRNSGACVLRGKWTIQDFETPDGADGPYYGADWGFSQDPTAVVLLWIKDRVLYVEHEAYAVGVELDDLPTFFDRVPGVRSHRIRADCARPETISHLARRNFNIVGAEKWTGSVEDGVAFLRSFEQIVIHTRCVHSAQEARLWSYKTDRLTGDVLPELVDAHNHAWDAVRYALEPIIRKSGTGLIDFYREWVNELGTASA